MNLILDTCGPVLLAAIARGANVQCFDAQPMQTGHAEAIVPALEALFDVAGIGPDADFKKIGVTVGPGSFTGLRVGLSVAKARAAVTGALLVPLNRLHCLAAASSAPGPARVQLDARRGEHFVQRFSAAGEPMDAPRTVLNEDLAALDQCYGDDHLVKGVADWGAFAAACAVLTDCHPGQSHRHVRPLYVRPPDAKAQPPALQTHL